MVTSWRCADTRQACVNSLPSRARTVSPCHRPFLPNFLIVITCKRRSDGSYPGPTISQHEHQLYRQSCQHGPLRGTLVSCFPDAWQITCPARRGIRQAAITSASHQVLSVMCCLYVHAGRRRAVGWVMFPSLPSSELVFDPPGSLGRVGKRANARTIPPILGQIGRHSLFFYVSLIWVELRLEAWRFLRPKIGTWRRGWVPS